MSSPVLRASGLGKQYVLRRDRSAALALLRRRPPERFWALRDVDLEVAPQEIVAVVGRNGAGKSTLLKVASGVTAPTTGSLTRARRVAPLIEVGAGFHPDLSGRDNVFVNARLLGLSARQARARFDDIVAFSELAHAIDRPVRQYSSGMFMRLGFSVAVHTEPELLVVDEVLAVGDLPFQVKCLDAIRELRNAGAGVLFVSHNLTAVLSLADRATLLEGGRRVHEGSPRDVVAAYHSLLAAREGADEGLELGDDTGATGDLEVLDLRVEDHGGAVDVALWEPGQEVTVRLQVRAVRPVDGGIVGFRLSREGAGMIGAWHESGSGSWEGLDAGESAQLTLRFRLNVTEGGYHLDLAIAQRDWGAMLLSRNGVHRFGVAPRAGAAGTVDLAPTLQWQPRSAS